MMNIFKNYETDMSILDDFDFYEERQKAMQERKARQQAGLMAVGDNEHRNAVAISGDFIKQMSKSFAQVVGMDEGSKEVTLTERASSASDGLIGPRVKLEDSLPAAVSSTHASQDGVSMLGNFSAGLLYVIKDLDSTPFSTKIILLEDKVC